MIASKAGQAGCLGYQRGEGAIANSPCTRCGMSWSDHQLGSLPEDKPPEINRDEIQRQMDTGDKLDAEPLKRLDHRPGDVFVLTHPGKLSREQMDAIKVQWDGVFQGTGTRMIVLDNQLSLSLVRPTKEDAPPDATATPQRPLLRITNETGRVKDTHVFAPNGEELRGMITRIEFDPFVSGSDHVKVHITFFAKIDFKIEDAQFIEKQLQK